MRRLSRVYGVVRKEPGVPAVEEAVLAACRRAEAQGCRIVANAHGLEVRAGVYAAADLRTPSCLPLEAVLLGQPRRTGFFEEDVARLLSVSRAWVEGFLLGFAMNTEADPMREGFQDGAWFRVELYGPGITISPGNPA
jgi:hypothetical protein